ncbi:MULTISPECIES: TRAP transporter large permease [unclassified Marinobacterium]|jgi:TRAP-type transport system large permease protein|uniref:TRAP transporter large permease n=1 Tax=unclassified Marinobacterium TaxID=2644139 RepID=UPI00156866F2|nr:MULTISPECIES: TRAP transporter large permease [unclassified Marinobacterium]NRP09059.1 Sialic acid TRAP transporter permease protein SiaT [Marinobacterium sp. xm-g-48]NRP15087.1 Sialic acid TRAP transporter permease protein SiaT [Marinobacterium sp. xm-a-152]NRP35834.1 Sialic acid TRAP transporter permease protein SiaT [Marinobacterium sp. xm-d-579]NRP39512.1 Sialic acid TRAP transporter permease protein SiaT [Marinobacterium sp. xm-a-121]NRP47581.1 Sialic acid TRAP transporter permease pro
MTYAILLGGIFIGLPIAFAIIAALLYFMAVGEFPYHLRIVATQMFGGMASYPLLAIPLFILAGELMNESGITSRIIAFANVLVGKMRAGLAMVNIWASVIFAGLSGSAVADTSAIGRVFIPEMEKKGYPREFAAAITAASSVIGPIIPPSIPVIIYALTVTGVSVPALFMAGVVPGVMLAIFLSVYVYFFKGHYEKQGTEHELGEKQSNSRALIQGIIPLLMPVFVVGSILMGVVTPTEAASFAVAYALFVGIFVFKELKVSKLAGLFARAMRDSSIIMVVIGAVAAANWLMNYNRVPNMITDFALEYMTVQWMFLVGVIILFLVVGLFLEGIAAMLVLVPILHPIAVSLGVDPTHLGIIIIFNLMIGLITPPMGLCLFVADSIAKVGMAKLSKVILPLFLVELLVLIIITFVPDLVIGLPTALGLL